MSERQNTGPAGGTVGAMQETYVDCSCGDFNHVVRFTLDDDGEVYLSYHLNDFEPWWKRAWYGLLYVFKLTPKYGHYDVTLLKQKDFRRLIDLFCRSAAISSTLAHGLAQEKPVLRG